MVKRFKMMAEDTIVDKTPEMIAITRGLGNPFSRFVLNLLTQKCKHCGKERIEKALELYSLSNGLKLRKLRDFTAGEFGLKYHMKSYNSKACGYCRIASSVISTVFEFGAKSFGQKIDKHALRYLQVKHVQRGIASVMKGIARYGVTRPQRLHAPFLVVWDYTNLCNLNCKHCYANANEMLANELTTEERYKIVDQLVDIGVVALAISGGEPLVRKDFWEIAPYAAENGLYISIATNGTLITKNIAKKLSKFIGYAEISLDGRRETHDEFRNREGAFDLAVRGMKNCVAAGITTCMATTVTKTNLKDVPYLINLGKKIGVDRFIAFNFIPTGRGKNIIRYDLSPEEREQLLFYLSQELEDGFEAFTTAPQFTRVTLERLKKEKRGKKGKLSPTHFAGMNFEARTATLAQFIGGCGAGRLYCSIEHNGDVKPCVFMPIVLGNLREERFEDIWRNDPILNQLRSREHLKGACGTCEYKYECGGCRARAYAYFNDLDAPDPGCILCKDAWDDLTKVKVKAQKISLH